MAQQLDLLAPGPAPIASVFEGRCDADVHGPTVASVASPLCSREGKCSRGGRAVLGPPHVLEDDGERCVNRWIRCLTCGCVGEESRRP